MQNSTHAAAVRRPSVLVLAVRQLWRDARAGELRLLLLAVTLAVMALTSVAFFADRLQAGLLRDARALLGGDAVVAADQPLPADVVAKARAMGLQAAFTANFPSMARAPDALGGESRLVAVKAVSQAYPLRGSMTLREADGREHRQAGGPPPGTVWVDEPVLEALGLQRGQNLILGDSALRIAAVIATEPDRGAGFMSFAPRVMLNEADLEATGLVQPASRVTYRLLVASSQGDLAVRSFVSWIEGEVKQRGLRGVRVEQFDNGRPELRQTLDRGAKFLHLVALLSALLSAVAVAIAARDFANRHLDDCAMLRVLGAPQRQIAWAYAIEFGTVGLLASALGVALGWGAHHAFVWLLTGLVQGDLPAAGPMPALLGLGVGLSLLVGFGLPPVLQLAQVPPLRVMRRQLGEPRAASTLAIAGGAVGFAALLMAAAQDRLLGAMAVGGFAVAFAVFAAVAWLAVKVLRRAVPEARAPRWLVLATRQLGARPGLAVLQVSSLSLGLMALVLLVLLRTDLVTSWRQATPPDAPNRFVINVQPDQAEAFQAALRSKGVAQFDWYPMIRGRLVAINGRDITPHDFAEDRAQRLVEREFNLSHAEQLPAHNQLAGGAWQPNEPGALSVEEGLAQTLHLKLGDSLRFDVAGQTQEGRITSLRKVDWGSMRANFFVMFPSREMKDLPATYIAAFRAPAEKGFDKFLNRQFPNITLVDVSASLAQVQRVLDQVIQAVEFLFTFTLASGLVVLFAAVTATREARGHAFAVMRALGASRGLLAQVQRAELLGLGALAGFLASAAAVGLGALLARYVFEFTWRPQPWVPLGGLLLGALLAWAAGWWGLRAVLRRPVTTSLRHAQD